MIFLRRAAKALLIGWIGFFGICATIGVVVSMISMCWGLAETSEYIETTGFSFGFVLAGLICYRLFQGREHRGVDIQEQPGTVTK